MKRSKILTGALFTSLGVAAACATNSESSQDAVLDGGQVVPSYDAGDAASDADAESDAVADVDTGPCSTSGLCTVPAPIDTRVTVTSISGSARGDVWAVGSMRSVLHFDGTTWEQLQIVDDTPATTMSAVWVGSATDVWTVDGNVLRHTTGWNGVAGTEWTKATPTYTPTALAGAGGMVLVGYKGPNGGVVVWPVVSACTGWGESGPAGCLDVNADFLWFDRNRLDIDAVAGVGTMSSTRADEAWAAIWQGGRVSRFQRVPSHAGDAEPTWTVTDFDSRSTRDILGIWGNDEVVWLVGEGGTLRRLAREDEATQVFELVTSPASSTLHGVFGFTKDDIWAVGDDATVVHWDGQAWTKLTTPFEAAKDKPAFTSVWGSGPNDVWIGGHGVMLHYRGDAQ